jgi:hypothetical protein
MIGSRHIQSGAGECPCTRGEKTQPPIRGHSGGHHRNRKREPKLKVLHGSRKELAERVKQRGKVIEKGTIDEEDGAPEACIRALEPARIEITRPELFPELKIACKVIGEILRVRKRALEQDGERKQQTGCCNHQQTT